MAGHEDSRSDDVKRFLECEPFVLLRSAVRKAPRRVTVPNPQGPSRVVKLKSEKDPVHRAV